MRKFLGYSLAIASFLITTVTFGQNDTSPNIILLLIDDMGWSDLACYGNEFHETPNIDNLASQGMKFTDAYASCGVCSPSRASILTGKYPSTLKITDWIPGHSGNKKFISPKMYYELPKQETTIAEVLKVKGYDTYYVGKWHLGTGDENNPLNHGFDENIGGHTKGAPGSFYFPYAKIDGAHDWTNKNLPKGHKEGDYLTDKLTDHALNLIEKSSKRDTPFFIDMSYYGVHVPLEGRPDLLKKYSKKYSTGKYDRKYNLHYASMVESVDQSVGRIINKLKELGEEKETLIILTSDNGGLAGGQFNGNFPLKQGKGTHYEGGIREPMIVVWPDKVKAGSISNEVVSGIDIYPTILEVVNSKNKEAVDGVSIQKILLNKNKKLDRKAMFWHYPHYHRGLPVSVVRSGNYKLIEFLETGKVELYDLKKDISEANDISLKKTRKVKELKDLLHTWKRENKAPKFLPKNKNTDQYDRVTDAWNGSNDITNPPVIKKEEKQIRLFTFNEAEIRYTLDGSIPSKTSILYKKPFALLNGGSVKAKSWSPNGMESHVIEKIIFLPEVKSKVEKINHNKNVLNSGLILDTTPSTVWEAANNLLPYEVVVQFNEEEKLAGFSYQPAKRVTKGIIPINFLKDNTYGAVLDFQILVSKDGVNWELIKTGTFDYRKYAFLEEKIIHFDKKVAAKFLNFRILSTIKPNQKPNIEGLKFFTSK